MCSTRWKLFVDDQGTSAPVKGPDNFGCTPVAVFDLHSGTAEIAVAELCSDSDFDLDSSLKSDSGLGFDSVGRNVVAAVVSAVMPDSQIAGLTGSRRHQEVPLDRSA